MNATSSLTPAVLIDAALHEMDDVANMVFVDDASYEFVGGGMAANGL